MSEVITEQQPTIKNVIREPSLYKVIFLNDESTPMEFVVDVLIHLFRHDLERAKEIMLEVHTKGSSVVAVLPYEIAEQKGVETTALARQAGYPLHVKIEAE